MWIFYHKMPVVAVDTPDDLAMFVITSLVIAAIVLAPSFLERKRNETRCSGDFICLRTKIKNVHKT